jgi:hypothetical protein
MVSVAFPQLKDSPVVYGGPLGRILVRLENRGIYEAIENVGAGTVRIAGAPLSNRNSCRSGWHKLLRERQLQDLKVVDINRNGKSERMNLDVAG